MTKSMVMPKTGSGSLPLSMMVRAQEVMIIPINVKETLHTEAPPRQMSVSTPGPSLPSLRTAPSLFHVHVHVPVAKLLESTPTLHMRNLITFYLMLNNRNNNYF